MKKIKFISTIFMVLLFSYFAQAQCTVAELNNFTIEQVDADCVTDAALKITYTGNAECYGSNLIAKIFDASKLQKPGLDPISFNLNRANNYSITVTIAYGKYEVYLEYQGTEFLESEIKKGTTLIKYVKPELKLVSTKTPTCPGGYEGSEIKVKLAANTGVIVNNNEKGEFTYDISLKESNPFTAIKTVGPTTDREVTFSDLPAGEYKVRVKHDLPGGCQDGHDIPVKINETTGVIGAQFGGRNGRTEAGCEAHCGEYNGYATLSIPKEEREAFIALINDTDPTNDPILLWYKKKGSDTWIPLDRESSEYKNPYVLVNFPHVPDGSIVRGFIKKENCAQVQTYDPNTATEEETKKAKDEKQVADIANNSPIVWGRIITSLPGNCQEPNVIMLVSNRGYFAEGQYPVCKKNATVILSRKNPGEADYTTIETITDAYSETNAVGTSGKSYPGGLKWPGKSFDITHLIKDNPLHSADSRYKITVRDACGREKSTYYGGNFKIDIPTLAEKLAKIIYADNGRSAGLYGTGSMNIQPKESYGKPPYSLTITRVDGQTQVPIPAQPDIEGGGKFTAKFPIHLKYENPKKPHIEAYFIEDLPAGAYNVSITDGCGTHVNKVINITKVAKWSMKTTPKQGCVGKVVIDLKESNVGWYNQIAFTLFKKQPDGTYKPLLIRKSDDNVYQEDQDNIPSNFPYLYRSRNFIRLVKNNTPIEIGNLPPGEYRISYFPSVWAHNIGRYRLNLSAATPKENYDPNTDNFSHRTMADVYDIKTTYDKEHLPIHDFHQDFTIKDYKDLTPDTRVTDFCGKNNGRITLDITEKLSDAVYPLTYTVTKVGDDTFAEVYKELNSSADGKMVIFDHLKEGRYNILFTNACNTNGSNFEVQLTDRPFTPPSPGSATNGVICGDDNITITIPVPISLFNVKWYNTEVLPDDFESLSETEKQEKLKEVWDDDKLMPFLENVNKLETNQGGITYRTIYQYNDTGCSDTFYTGKLTTKKAIDDKNVYLKTKDVCKRDNGIIIIEDAQEGIRYCST